MILSLSEYKNIYSVIVERCHPLCAAVHFCSLLAAPLLAIYILFLVLITCDIFITSLIFTKQSLLWWHY